MSAAETRNAAYCELRDSGKLGARQRQIMLALHAASARDFSLQEIAALTGLPINVVSGRVFELKNMQPPYLIEGAKRKCSCTGRTVTPVAIYRGQMELFGRAA